MHATLLHTVLDVKGECDSGRRIWAGRSKGGLPGDSGAHVPGHLIDIAVESNQVRVEDVLTLGAKTSPPLMSGALTLRARLQIPPGEGERIAEDADSGEVYDSRGDVLEPDVAGDGGQAERAGAGASAAGERDRCAGGDLTDGRGFFTGEWAAAYVPDLKYQMPGAQVDVAGDYGLSGGKV